MHLPCFPQAPAPGEDEGSESVFNIPCSALHTLSVLCEVNWAGEEGPVISLEVPGVLERVDFIPF